MDSDDEMLLAMAAEILADLRALPLLGEAFYLKNKPEVLSHDSRWVSLATRSKRYAPCGIWLWSDAHSGNEGLQRLLWFGLESNRREIDRLKMLIREEWNTAGWADSDPAPDLRDAVTEDEEARSYLGIFKDYRRQETRHEFCRRCMDFLSCVLKVTLLVGPDTEIYADVEQIRTRADLDETERDQLIKARLGQGRFRTALLDRWGNACAVTRSTVFKAIRASHAKAWRDSSDKERLDPANGLPLIATLDALFDAHLITFDDEGNMLLSPELEGREADELDQLGLRQGARLFRVPADDELNFLRYHRGKFRQGRS